MPTVIIAAAVVLAVGLLVLDARVDERVAQTLPWLREISGEGSRSILTAIAGSMITVAGVVFSITVVVLSLAASQYTSRVLRNFMRDRATQVVLGVFVGVFGYCLVVLTQVRGVDGREYAPIIATLGGIALAFVAIGYLIFFIHHIAASIQIAEILARAAGETLYAVEELFPEDAGDAVQDERASSTVDADSGVAWRSVPSLSTGYVQTVEIDRLLELATRHDTVVRLECDVGQFASEGVPLAFLKNRTDLDDATIERINACFTIDTQRTIEQDPAFGIRQITDIALRALSPGVNDTTTAIMCLDYASVILTRLTRRKFPERHRRVDGKLRLITCGSEFGDMVAEAISQIRENAANNPAVLMRLFALLQTLETTARALDRRRILLQHARATLEIVRRTVSSSQEREELERRAQQVIAHLERARPADYCFGTAHSSAGVTFRDTAA